MTKKAMSYEKRKKIILGVTIPLAVILLFVLLCFSTYIPRVNGTDYASAVVQANPIIQEKTLVSAHRAGRTLAPENTMAAFEKCFESMYAEEDPYSVDILEFDLHLTGDAENKKLVLLHDDTLDRTSDCVAVHGEKDVKPINKTFAQLQEYNMGYNFQDPQTGEYIYRKEGADLSSVHIVDLETVLTYVQSQEAALGKKIGYIIEIKDGGEHGYEAAELLKKIMKEYGILEYTVIGTFHGEVSKYLDEKCPEITRSAGIAEVLSFYFSYMFNIPLTNVNYKVLQIPYKDFGLNFGKKGMVDYAHKYGIAVQYWTINKKEDIEHLSKIGADAIMSDNPKLCYDVVEDVFKK